MSEADEREGSEPTRSLVRLPVLASSASAATSLAAFHRALGLIGVGHHNLVRLSSVIPPGVEVTRSDAGAVGGGWGDRLYCVYADQRATEPGQEAWAGVGWVQRVDGRGGLFVEHEGTTEQEVLDQVGRSLADMSAFESAAFGEPEWVVTGVRCERDPVCALVLVPYATAGWGPHPALPAHAA